MPNASRCAAASRNCWGRSTNSAPAKAVAVNTSEKRPVRVTILSQSYALLTAGDPREVEDLARGVDELMLSIAAKSPNADSTRIAVLACLHLADRLHSLEQDLNRLRESGNPKKGEVWGGGGGGPQRGVVGLAGTVC